jgi:hypothetical protein
VLSNTERVQAKLEPICNCDTCEGDEHTTLIADP